MAVRIPSTYYSSSVRAAIFEGGAPEARNGFHHPRCSQFVIAAHSLKHKNKKTYDRQIFTHVLSHQQSPISISPQDPLHWEDVGRAQQAAIATSSEIRVHIMAEGMAFFFRCANSSPVYRSQRNSQSCFAGGPKHSSRMKSSSETPRIWPLLLRRQPLVSLLLHFNLF